jgi:hypothetical protein
LERNEAAIGEDLERSGCYILATNVLPGSGELTDDELLAEYKGRHSVESGFRFLKDPLLRWVFQLFQAVHLLSVDGAKRISNLTEERRSILFPGSLLPTILSALLKEVRNVGLGTCGGSLSRTSDITSPRGGGTRAATLRSAYRPVGR